MYMIFEELENNVVDWGIRKGILGDLELATPPLYWPRT